jgi:hypothetical protein
MSTPAQQLVQAIETGDITLEQIRQQVHALPREQVRAHPVLAAAWAATSTDPVSAVAALRHAARLINKPAEAQSKIATTAAKTRAQLRWDENYGPGFDLYEAIQRAADRLGLSFGAFPTAVAGFDDEGDPIPDGWKLFVPAAAERRKLTGAVKAELQERFPQAWPPERTLYIDKAIFRAAFSEGPRNPFAAFDEGKCTALP